MTFLRKVILLITNMHVATEEFFLADRILLHSMIGYWHHPVVRLSVCLSVQLCIVTLRVGVNSCTSVFLAGMFLFVSSDTFAVGCIV